MKSIVWIQYGFVLVVGLAMAVESLRLNKKAFVNNEKVYYAILGENPELVRFSDKCVNLIEHQISDAIAAGANKQLTDSITKLVALPNKFLKRIQDITYLNNTLKDDMMIDDNEVRAVVFCGSRSYVKMEFSFIRKGDTLICQKVNGVRELLVDVSRAFP